MAAAMPELVPVAEAAALEADERIAEAWLEREAAAEPVAVEAWELMLARAEEAPPSMEERRDEASLATELTPEETAELMELRTDEAPLSPGTAD